MIKHGIVGANSYIGRHVALLLLKDHQDVELYDIDESSKDFFKKYQKIDFRQPDTLAAIAEDIDVIYFFTGLTGTISGFDRFDDFIDVNEKTLLHLLNLFRARKSKARIIFPSSRLVYKGRNNTPLKENDEKEPKTIYAVNKLCCEKYLKIYHECFGINYTVARICVPYGNLLDATYSYGTIGFMLARARDSLDISIYGDGSQKRSFIHIEDLANMLISVGADPRTKGEILNVGGPDAMSILEAATLIANKYNVKITHADWPALESKIETGDTIFDSGKIENLLNYQYRHRFQEWVKSL
jgi:UDP-glucose 4-epimerase